MKIVSSLLILTLSASALFLSGCVTSPGGVAPSTVPITSKDTYTIVKTDASGGDATLCLLMIPLKPCSAYNALQKAKKQYGADAFINVTIENKSYWLTLLPLISYQRISVRGDAIKFNRGKAD